MRNNAILGAVVLLCVSTGLLCLTAIRSAVERRNAMRMSFSHPYGRGGIELIGRHK